MDSSDTDNRIYGAVATGSKVRSGNSYNSDEAVIAIGFEHGYDTTVVVVDRATASRLIRQLQRVLDESYNEMINQRPERDASKDYSSGY